MRAWAFSISATLTGAAFGTAFTGTAWAQDEGATAAARALGQEGVLAAQAGHCDEAIDKLTRAKSLMPAPSILVPLGECQISVGKVVAGTENLQAAAREKLADNAPKAFSDAQDRARQILPDALKKLGRLTVTVEAPPGTSFTVTDNGEAVSSVLIGAERPADPGKHVIEVSAQGFKSTSQEVRITSGQKGTVKLVLEADPNAKPGAPLPTGPDTSAKPKTDAPVTKPANGGSSGMVPAGGVVLGVGGVGILLGAVFGGLAASKKSDLDDVCTADKACPRSASGDISDLKTFGNVSTSAFVVGGVCAALGATLLGIGVAKNSAAEKSAIVPEVGPGYLGLRGRF